MTTSVSTLPQTVARSETALKVLMMGVLPLWEDRGDAIHLREVALALQERGMETIVLCLPGPETPPGITLPEVRVSPSRKRFRFQFSWNWWGTLAAVRTIRREGIDVIYSRLEPGMIVGWLAARLTGRPLVIEMNGLPSEDARLYRQRSRILPFITRLWEGWMYRASRAIVAAPGYAEYARSRFHVPERKCCVTPLGVNTALFRARDRAECCREVEIDARPTVAWMGTLAGWQGLQTLVQAAKQVREVIPDVRFLIVGDGAAREQCEREVDALGLRESFQFTGHVPYERVPLYLGAAQVCVATFPGNRGKKGTISALKTISYLACGRPVVTSEMDEMGQTIAEHDAGAVVPADNPRALAEQLVALLREPNDIWQQRGDQAVSLVGYERTWGATADRIAARLREVAR